MKLIPAIDLLDGKCVRLTQGDYSKVTVYHDSPTDMAKEFEQAGIEVLHLVDLEGAREGKVQHLRTLERIATQTKLHVEFSGGLSSRADIQAVLDAGADEITIGSVAAKQQELFLEWLNEFGPEQITLSADARNGKIATDGWVNETDLKAVDYITFYRKKGIKRVISTDINRDGAMQGPSLELYRTILASNPRLNLIASGGVSSEEDIWALASITENRGGGNGLYGVVLGKIIYEGILPLDRLRNLSEELEIRSLKKSIVDSGAAKTTENGSSDSSTQS